MGKTDTLLVFWGRYPDVYLLDSRRGRRDIVTRLDRGNINFHMCVKCSDENYIPCKACAVFQMVVSNHWTDIFFGFTHFKGGDTVHSGDLLQNLNTDGEYDSKMLLWCSRM